ncbi:MAG: hypothetical protein ABMB14_04085 [Myxococcota bacterium]
MFWMMACRSLPLDPPADGVFLVYDPVAGAIPAPNDLVRDPIAGRLALPIDPSLGPAEAELRGLLNTQDGWSTTAPIGFAVSAPLDLGTIDAVSVLRWDDGRLVAVDGLAPVVAEDGRSVAIAPPLVGWDRGGTYLVAVRGGDDGLRADDGRPVGPDAAYVLLNAPDTLLGHDHAVPGATAAERAAAIAQLEAHRTVLAPLLDRLEADGTPRATLAGAFLFTVTGRPELAMDPASQRMPLPFDLLIDPVTGLVALPPAPDDDALTTKAKAVLNTYRGFSLTGDLGFQATAPLDVATVGVDTVELWSLGGDAPTKQDASVTVWNDAGPCAPRADDCRYVVVDPAQVPLDPGGSYAVVVRDGVTGVDGAPLAPMGIGALLRLGSPVAVGGASQVLAATDADAVRVEGVRTTVAPLLDAIGRDGIVAAWPFRTIDPLPDLTALVGIPDQMAYDATPTVLDQKPLAQFFGDDALGWLFPPDDNLVWPLYYYDDVRVPDLPADYGTRAFEGTIPAPQFLDPVTRAWVADPTMTDIHFVATVPTQIPADQPVPVVIFTHGVIADRRWLVTVASEFSKRGFAAVSIDLPYHGERTTCVDASLAALPNFIPPALRDEAQDLVGPSANVTDDLISLYPCASGADASCSRDGRCLDRNGDPEPFAHFPPDPPLVDILPAAGAAMLYVDDLPYIPAHLDQALVDLAALRYSLQTADWATALGHEIQTDRFHYAGHSLGSILGAVYAAVDPTIDRAVLNVPAADLVEVFVNSTQFSPQLEVFFDELGVADGSYERHELLNAARWLSDAADPIAVGHVWKDERRRLSGLIQIDRVDHDGTATSGDLVIPNFTTDRLADVTGLPVKEYGSILHVDLLMPTDIGDAMLIDMAAFLAGEER